MHTEESRTANGAVAALGGLGLGAALMYFLDPSRGARRRALTADRARRVTRRTQHAVESTVRDIENRAQGVASRVRNARDDDHPTDDVLVARVRSELGRVCSHPRAIIVTAESGHITLSGPVLEREVPAILSAARGTRGVQGVDNRLEAHEQPGNVPSLQGGVPRTGTHMELMQEHWTPAARLLVGTGGAALLGWGLERRDGVGAALGLLGAALLTRSLTNLSPERLVGIGEGRQSIAVHKATTIFAPVDQVFDFFSHYDNFPAFMSHVREVEDRGDGRSHWTVDGPGGIPVQWDAELTAKETNRRIAWRSTDGSIVAHEGEIRFQPTEGGATRVEVHLEHSPPAGALGHAVATAFRRDPRHQLDDDLVRAKTYLETGHRARDARRAASDVEMVS